jgi:hypothetical protein
MFKSPSPKLVQFFKTSRDRWKRKALLRRDRIKALQVRIRDLSESRDRWKSRARSAESNLRSERVEVHSEE